MFLFSLVIVSLGAVSTLADKGSYGYKGKGVYEYEYGYGKARQYGRQRDKYQAIGQYGRRGHKYQTKYECKVNRDCIKGYICSDNYCVPDCGPCSEFDFTTGYCKYLCARNAKCVRGSKYSYKCFCPYCPGMDGYDKYANCRPPKYLKGICYSYDRLTKALPPKHANYYYNDYYKANKAGYGYGKNYDAKY